MQGIEVWRKSSNSVVKWSEMKCSDVRWNVEVGNLNGVKPNERAVKCSWWSLNARKWSVEKCSDVEWSVVGWNVVKGNEGLSNRVSDIFRRYEGELNETLKYFNIIVCSFLRFSFDSPSYVDLDVCSLYGLFVYHILLYSFGSIFYNCIYGCMFCILCIIL